MRDRETYILSQVLGPDDPRVKALIWAARDPKTAGAVRALLRGLCREQGIDPDDPPAFGLPVSLSPCEFAVGRAKCGERLGVPVGPTEPDFMGHIGVFGATGQGKTTLVKMLIEGFCRQGRRTALIIDSQGEYRDLMLRFPPGRCIWLTVDQLGLNPFEIPRDERGDRVMEPAKWIGELEEWIRLFWLNDPSCHFFADILTDVYRDRGVFNGEEDYPSLSEVIDAIEAEDVQRGSEAARAKVKVQDRLSSMRRLLPGLDVRRSRDIHQLLGHCVVLDVSDAKDAGLPGVFSLLITLLWSSCRIEPDEPVERLLVVEEAHRYFGGQVSKRTQDLKESVATSSLRYLRKAGFCAVLSNQLVSDLDKAVVGNLNSVICMRLTREQCIREAASMLGLEKWQQGELGSLGRREAIVRFSRHADPIHLAVSEVGSDVLGLRLSRAQAAELSKPLLHAIPFEPSPEPEEQERETAGPGTVAAGKAKPKRGCATCTQLGLGLNRACHKVMEAVCERPAESIEDRCDRLQMRREIETPARQRLIALNLVGKAGMVGNRRYLFEPTELGKQWSRDHGIRVPKYHGSLVHEYCTVLAEKKLAKAVPGTSFRRRNNGQPGGVRPDTLAALPGKGSARIAIQIVVGHEPRGEAVNLLKLLHTTREEAAREGRLGVLDLVVCVAINKRVEDSISRALKKQRGGKLPPEIVLLNAEEHLIDPAYDWTNIVSRNL